MPVFFDTTQKFVVVLVKIVVSPHGWLALSDCSGHWSNVGWESGAVSSTDCCVSCVNIGIGVAYGVSVGRTFVLQSGSAVACRMLSVAGGWGCITTG